MFPSFKTLSSQLVWVLADTWVRHIKPVIVPLITWDKSVGWMLVSKDGDIEVLQGDPWRTQIRTLAEFTIEPGSFLVAWNRDVIVCDKTAAGFCKKLAQTAQRVPSLPRVFMGVRKVVHNEAGNIEVHEVPKEFSMRITDNVMRVVSGLHACGNDDVCALKVLDAPEALAVSFLSKENFTGEMDVQWS
jgi:hypothetical protein